MRVVSLNVSHDSSVCSYVNGKVEYYCKEERLSGIKRDPNPILSLEKLFSQNLGKVDHFLYLTPTNCQSDGFDLYNLLVRKFFNIELENFSSLLHHSCHASLSFYNSGFSECLVFVVDRNGSIVFNNLGNPIARETESVFKCSYPDEIVPIYKSFSIYEESYKYMTNALLSEYYHKDCDMPDLEINASSPWGIVKVYESATSLIGQPSLENGKTMGLSSYGVDDTYERLFHNGSPISQYFTSIDLREINSEPDSTCFWGLEDKITQHITKENYRFYANKAKHVQIETQTEVLRLIEKYVNKTGIKNVCLVGGYGLNVVANNFYIESLPDVNFYFEPMSDDSGITIGASMLKYRMQSKDKNIYKMRNNFFHFYEKEYDTYGNKTSIEELIDILCDQKIIAIFEGNPEAGPRSLGHRSLVFDPRNPNGKDIVNTLKNREWYRPFAGIILEEHFENYFHTLNVKKSEFMTINFKCKSGTDLYVPSIIHVDNTCRIQTVSKNDTFLFELLTKFYEKTGCPMLLNTSFNLSGKPLVQSKKDVLHFSHSVSNNNHFAGTYFVEDETFLKN